MLRRFSLSLAHLTAQEAKKAIIIHIVEMYGERFKPIETFGVVEQIHRKYAQFHDVSSPATTTTGEPIDRLAIPLTQLILDINCPMASSDGGLASRRWTRRKKNTLTETRRKKHLPNRFQTRNLVVKIC